MLTEVGEDCVVIYHMHADGHEDELALRTGWGRGSDGRQVPFLGFLNIAKEEEKCHKEDWLGGRHGDQYLHKIGSVWGSL